MEYLEGPAEQEIASGKIHVELRGMKLRGRYALVKLAKSEKGNEWLLFKKADEHSSTERSLVDELPRSVLSGLTVEELEGAEAIGAAHVERAFERGAKKLSARDANALAAPKTSPLIAPAASKPRAGAA